MNRRRLRRVLRRSPAVNLVLGITAGVLLIVAGLWCWADYLDVTGPKAANTSLLAITALAVFALQAALPRRRRQR